MILNKIKIISVWYKKLQEKIINLMIFVVTYSLISDSNSCTNQYKYKIML